MSCVVLDHLGTVVYWLKLYLYELILLAISFIHKKSLNAIDLKQIIKSVDNVDKYWRTFILRGIIQLLRAPCPETSLNLSKCVKWCMLIQLIKPINLIISLSNSFKSLSDRPWFKENTAKTGVKILLKEYIFLSNII